MAVMAGVGAWAATNAGAITAVSTAVSIAGTAFSAYQQSVNADAMEKAQEARNQQIQEQTIANYDELAEVERDAQQQALDESMEVNKEYMKERGRINVTAAALGTTGMSVAGQLQDLEKTKYSNYNTILLNRQAKMDNIKSQAESLRYQATSQMDVSPISRPSWAATALNIGGQAISGFGKYSDIQREGRMLREPQISAGG